MMAVSPDFTHQYILQYMSLKRTATSIHHHQFTKTTTSSSTPINIIDLHDVYYLHRPVYTINNKHITRSFSDLV